MTENLFDYGILSVIAMAAFCLTACATQAASPAPAPAFVDATYQFSEQLPGMNKAVSGTVRLLGNTAVMDAQPGPCRPLPGAANSGDRTALTFQCGDVLYRVDRSTSVVSLHYNTTKTVTENKTTCVRYEINSSGARVCAQTQTDPVERNVAVSGVLRLSPVPNP